MNCASLKDLITYTKRCSAGVLKDVSPSNFSKFWKLLPKDLYLDYNEINHPIILKHILEVRLL